MKRLGAACEELFMASTTHVDERKKSTSSEEWKQTNDGAQTISGRSTCNSTDGGRESSANVRVVPRAGSLPRSSRQPSDGSSVRTEPPSRDIPVRTSSGVHVPDRSQVVSNKGTKPKVHSASMPRSQSRPRTSRHSSTGPGHQHASGKYRAQSLTINPSLCNSTDEFDQVSPREVQGLHRKSVALNTDLIGSDRRGVGESGNDEIVFARPISIEKLTRQDTCNRSSAPTLKTVERRSGSSSDRNGDALGGGGPSALMSQPSLAPRLPQTSAVGAPPKRRAKSERMEPFRASSSSSHTVSQPRHLGRAVSLRSEGVSILPNLFSRGRLLSWPLGVAPQVVYAAETSHELDDGHGAAGLSATLLCKMGAKHRAWDVVQAGDRFCIRVVGWHGGELRTMRGGEGRRAVVYSNLHKDDGNRNCSDDGGPAQVHDECACSEFRGYHYVSERRGAVASSYGSSEREHVGLTVGLWAGGGRGEELGFDLRGEVRWRLLRDGDSEAKGRNGATLMRFGYYFFLDVPCATRLFTNTDTPEHVRLVARRAGDGAIDEEASKQLTYVVVRVSAD